MIMKKCGIVSLIFSLIVSLAAPAGAVFAMDEGETETPASIRDTLITTDDKAVESEDVTASETGIMPAQVGDESESEIITSNEADVANSEPFVLSEQPETPVIDSGQAFSAGVVISRLQTTGGTGKTDEELIELYNNSDEPIDITDWCVESYKKANPAAAILVGCISAGSGIGWRVILPSRRPYVFASASFIKANKDVNGKDFAADQAFAASGVLNNDDGRIILRDAAGHLHDAVTWGGATELPIDQGLTRAVINKASYVLERRFDDDTMRYIDTDDNNADFLTNVSRGVYLTGRAEEVYDACLNVPGLQTTPGQLYRDEITGQCTDTRPQVNLCPNIVLSEVAANVEEQFIELQNISGETVSLAGCKLQTNHSTKSYVFSESEAAEPGQYVTILIADTGLTLTKTTTGTVYLLSSDGSIEVDTIKYSSLSKETSWSRIGNEWKQTYVMTPSAANVYAKYPACDEGYWRNEETGRCSKIIEPVALTDCGEGRERNPATGRCRNIATGSTLAPCKEGQYRSEETNRCRSIASAAASVLKPCADDQFRNPETNRCKKIASAEELADCGEGRERNPETNRCRNVRAASMPLAPFAAEQVTQTAQGTLGWWVFGGASLLAVGYAGWQWRFEMGRLARKVRGAVLSGPKE